MYPPNPCMDPGGGKFQGKCQEKFEEKVQIRKKKILGEKNYIFFIFYIAGNCLSEVDFPIWFN